MANEKILQVVDLCKSFHKLDVLKHISVDFEKNEVVDRKSTRLNSSHAR